jgi:hypothetical protein
MSCGETSDLDRALSSLIGRRDLATKIATSPEEERHVAVKCDVEGMTRLVVEIDLDVGLAAGDLDLVLEFFSEPGRFTEGVVEVDVYGPGTTNRDLLEQMEGKVANRVRELGKELAFHVYLSPP